jgi:Cu(I)/Ag(I) efflux system membrane protein CusA/SilA
MKPLATPVLGGMVSSLIHVLIVTPVIFFWLRERQLGLQHEALPDTPRSLVPRRAVVFGLVGMVVVAGALAAWTIAGRGGRVSPGEAPGISVVQTINAGEIDIVLLSQDAALRQGRNTFTIEFRRAGTGVLVDVGAVRASGNMTMPGMVMSSGLQVMPSGVPGRYMATAEFGMAGTWQMAIDWNGPAGQGSVNFQGSVQ